MTPLDQYAREIAEYWGLDQIDKGVWDILQRLRDEVLEEAAKACEEHTEHMDFGGQPQDHHEPPFRCNVAEAVRALGATRG